MTLSSITLEAGQSVADAIDHIIQNTSEKFVGSSTIHHLRASTLSSWCSYVVDASIEHELHWTDPEEWHLRWWYDLPTSQSIDSCFDESFVQHSLDWAISLSSAYYNLAQAMYLDQIESLYVERRVNYEKVHCKVYDCGPRHGVAIEASIGIESGLDTQQLLAQFPQTSEIISLSDVSQGIPQILASTSPGSWLPPFFNGSTWVLLQTEHIERPSLQDLKLILLRDVCKDWRNSRTENLVSYWTDQLSHQ